MLTLTLFSLSLISSLLSRTMPQFRHGYLECQKWKGILQASRRAGECWWGISLCCNKCWIYNSPLTSVHCHEKVSKRRCRMVCPYVDSITQRGFYCSFICLCTATDIYSDNQQPGYGIYDYDGNLKVSPFTLKRHLFPAKALTLALFSVWLCSKDVVLKKES